MISIVISPYAGTGTDDDAYRPLLDDVLPGVRWTDGTGRVMRNGPPATNMLVVGSELTGSQVSQLKSDSRFFVLKPGPGNKGQALINWLNGKGASGHGVTENDDADIAIAKLRRYCREDI